MSRPVLFWLAVLLLVAGVTTVAIAVRSSNRDLSGSQGVVDLEYLNSPDVSKVDWLKDFTLTERSGKKISSTELRGRPYVASFFFTVCPTECLRQNEKIGELAREFKGTDFVFLSITCDPENDTPGRLREYADKLKADKNQWLFLTGDLTYLKRVAAEMFRVPLDKQSHTERFLVVDRNGEFRQQFGWKDPAQMTDLRQMMQDLLKEEAKPSAAKEDGSVPAEPPPADEPAAATNNPSEG